MEKGERNIFLSPFVIILERWLKRPPHINNFLTFML